MVLCVQLQTTDMEGLTLHKTNNNCCTPHKSLGALVDTSDTMPERPEHGISDKWPTHDHADHIFYGNIVTMDAENPTAEAVAFKHGTILEVGSKAAVDAHKGQLTHTEELGAKVMYPGFVEAHMHIWITAINYAWLDCSPFANPKLDDVLHVLSKAVDDSKDGEWVLGRSFDPSLYDGFPELTTKDLDPIAPNNPVFVFNASMHFAYVNSKALEVIGITKDTPDPAGGKFGRYEDGTPNGIIIDPGALEIAIKHINKIKIPGVIENIHSITKDAAKAGVTTMREAATGALLGEKEIDILHLLKDLGVLKTRLSLALLDSAAKDWPVSKHNTPGSGDDRVWVSTRKIVADGSLQGRTGYLREPYLNTDTKGFIDITQQDLTERIKWCNDNNWQVMVHANGDAALDIATASYHDALSQSPKKDLRHRIEHVTIARDEIFDKMAADGVSPSFLINHIYYWGEALRDTFLGKERAHLLDRLKTAKQKGLKLSMHSDYNVTPINPLHNVKVAVTRTTLQHNEVMNAEEAISVYDALRAVTIDAAWQLNADHKVGSLAKGKLADIVVLEHDPQKVEPTKIDTIKVVETWVGGKLVSQLDAGRG